MFKTASYVKSIVHIDPTMPQKPEVLMLGRSNVGKSSFINSLTGRKNLARVSKTPGKTLLLNYYNIEDTFYIVDAPGYGYAKRSKSMKDDFIVMIERYLLNNTQLRLVCLLVDFKVGPTKDDLATYDFLRSMGKPILVVCTKKDKIPKTKQFKQEKLIKQALSNPEQLISISNQTKDNIGKVEALFREVLI